MHHPAWSLVVTGILIAGIGLVWLVVPSIPWLGKLPGHGKTVTVYSGV